MLQAPKTHVRQRSIGRYEAEKKDAELSSEPLLEEAVALTPITAVFPERNNTALYILWASSLVLTALLTYLLTTHAIGRNDGFRLGFETELRSARSAISVTRQQFHGSLDFRNRHGFIPADSISWKYVGSTPDVDAAWNELVEDRYFLLSDSEARAAFGDDDLDRYWNVHHGGYAAGLDVLHTLHCVNQLRMSLYPSVYPQDPEHGVMHKAHCVDHLRQLAMCGSDLTPIPTQWFDGIGQNYINSSRVHTCRDFWKIREWTRERFNGSTAVKPRNRDGTPRENFYEPWSP